MFSNLVESNSHRNELKRRGSFVLYTTATYAVLLIAAGVASIYAYDARLEEQNLEMVTLMRVVDIPVATPPSTERVSGGVASGNNRNPFVAKQKTPTASTNEPQLVPRDISLNPNPNPQLPNGLYRGRQRDWDGGYSGPGIGTPSGGSPSATNVPSVKIDELPPPPADKPVPRILYKPVINSEAISLPKPAYPKLAVEARIQGSVAVQVLIDEAGRVVSAQVISGHPVLAGAARNAAYHARFSPTKIGDQPVKVSGIITYNFVLR